MGCYKNTDAKIANLIKDFYRQGKELMVLSCDIITKKRK
jgi:hypothetical protein